jgi:hypothetical protein
MIAGDGYFVSGKADNRKMGVQLVNFSSSWGPLLGQMLFAWEQMMMYRALGVEAYVPPQWRGLGVEASVLPQSNEDRCSVCKTTPMG